MTIRPVVTTGILVCDGISGEGPGDEFGAERAVFRGDVMTMTSTLLVVLAAVAVGLAVILVLRVWSGRSAVVTGGRSASDPSARRRFRGRWLAGAGVVLIVAGGVFWFARPAVVAPTAVASVTPGGGANSGGDLSPLIVRLREKLKTEPDNGEGWLLLARAYGQLRQYSEASAAYREAAGRLPPDAGLLADWTDALVMSRQRQWDDESRSVLKRGLATDPRHAKSLSLAGSEAFGRADYRTALTYWEKMKAVVPEASMERRLAEVNIAEAQRLMAGKP